MRIDAELDPIHSERLETLLEHMKHPLPEVLAIAIDAAYGELVPEGRTEDSALFEALESIGFVGRVDDDPDLSATYKNRIDFSAKSGVKPGSSSTPAPGSSFPLGRTRTLRLAVALSVPTTNP